MEINVEFQLIWDRRRFLYTVCNQQYVGQAFSSFSARWTQHRHVWQTYLNNENQQRKDKAAVVQPYYDEHHKIIWIATKPDLHIATILYNL